MRYLLFFSKQTTRSRTNEIWFYTGTAYVKLCDGRGYEPIGPIVMDMLPSYVDTKTLNAELHNRLTAKGEI